MYAGRIETRILTIAQAETLGCEDDYVKSTADHKLFVNSFDSLEAVHSYLEDLVGCTLVE